LRPLKKKRSRRTNEIKFVSKIRENRVLIVCFEFHKNVAMLCWMGA